MRTADRPQSTRARILVPFAIVTLIWGSTWLVIRDQISIVPPSWSVSYRFLIAGLAMGAYALARGESLLLDRRGFLFAAALGTLQFALNFNFVYRAEAHITSGLVAVVFALLLVPNAVLGRIFLGQRLGAQLLIGSLIAVAGVALLFIHEARVAPSAGSEVILGIALTLCGVMCASAANVMQATDTARRYPMTAVIAVAMLVGGAVDAGFALATVGAPVMEWRAGYVAGLLYLALAGSTLAFPLYFSIIRTIGPAKAAYNSVLVPVIAMLLSTVFEGYRWSPLAIAGAALAGVGLVVALTARRPAR